MIPDRAREEGPSDSLLLLEESLQLPDEEIDIGYVGLVMASRHYAGLDIPAYLRRMDELAFAARSALGRATTPARVIGAINGALFGALGLRGNTEDYYDPRNSFLNEVLDRRTGIPISISAVYLAVAHRMKQPVVGVGLPAHFIVKLQSRGGDVLIDPFSGGEVLTTVDCARRMEAASGAPIAFNEAYLAPVSPRAMVYRMLNNLKQIYLRQGDLVRAGAVVDQMLVVRPHGPDDLHDRGLIYARRGEWSRADEYLARYLREHPGASDADSVRRQLHVVREQRARRN